MQENRQGQPWVHTNEQQANFYFFCAFLEKLKINGSSRWELFLKRKHCCSILVLFFLQTDMLENPLKEDGSFFLQIKLNH